MVRESADLLYNLVVLWAEAGVRPQDVWDEMARRERLFGLAEKVPKKLVETNAPPQGGPARKPPQPQAALSRSAAVDSARRPLDRAKAAHRRHVQSEPATPLDMR